MRTPSAGPEQEVPCAFLPIDLRRSQQSPHDFRENRRLARLGSVFTARVGGNRSGCKARDRRSESYLLIYIQVISLQTLTAYGQRQHHSRNARLDPTRLFRVPPRVSAGFLMLPKWQAHGVTRIQHD